MTIFRGRHYLLAALLAVYAFPAVGQSPLCSASGCVPGGGSPNTDCQAEWLLTPMPPLAGNGLPSRKVVCYEGDPFCDIDPDINDARCVFSMRLCINNDDSRLPDCLPSDVTTFEVRKPSSRRPRTLADENNLAALETRAHEDFGVTVLRDGEPFLSGVPNATVGVCSDTFAIHVPLRQRRSGRVVHGKRTLRIDTIASNGRRDGDSLKLQCRPSTCGNGTIESHEDCDDGNRTNGDGCNQGCRLEAPTPTPTPTLVPTSTGTITVTATITPPSTATFTATLTASITPTATDTVPLPTNTATPTASSTATATAVNTATATAADTATATATGTATLTPTPTATATPPSITLGIVAFRPLSEGYGAPFQRRAVPVGENLTPGAGVRFNGDDDNNNGNADHLDGAVSGENDLVELTLQANPVPAPAGYEYILRRSNAGVKVWNGPSKDNSAVLDTGTEAPVGFSGPTRTLWVERNSVGTTLLELVARPIGGGADLASTSVRLFSFTSVIIALGGENQGPSDPPNGNHGMFNIALSLYTLGYDVHMYDEDNVSSSGGGAPYDEVVRAVSRRGVGDVSIYGYSHGGGATWALADRLNNNRGSIGTFNISYTAYVDAIRNSSDIDIRSETRLPPTTAYHVNYYQRNDFFIKGDDVPGANVDVNVNDTPWGGGLDHGNVDDHANVRDGVLQPLIVRVPR